MKKFLNEEIVVKQKVWEKLLNVFIRSVVSIIVLGILFKYLEKSDIIELLIKLNNTEWSKKIDILLISFPIILIILEMIELGNIVTIQSKNKKRTLK